MRRISRSSNFADTTTRDDIPREFVDDSPVTRLVDFHPNASLDLIAAVALGSHPQLIEHIAYILMDGGTQVDVGAMLKTRATVHIVYNSSFSSQDIPFRRDHPLLASLKAPHVRTNALPGSHLDDCRNSRTLISQFNYRHLQRYRNQGPLVLSMALTDRQLTRRTQMRKIAPPSWAHAFSPGLSAPSAPTPPNGSTTPPRAASPTAPSPTRSILKTPVALAAPPTPAPSRTTPRVQRPPPLPAPPPPPTSPTSVMDLGKVGSSGDYVTHDQLSAALTQMASSIAALTATVAALANTRALPPPAATVPLPPPLSLPNNVSPGFAPPSATQAGSGHSVGALGTRPYPTPHPYLYNPHLPTPNPPPYGGYGAFMGFEGLRGYGNYGNYGNLGNYGHYGNLGTNGNHANLGNSGHYGNLGNNGNHTNLGNYGHHGNLRANENYGNQGVQSQDTLTPQPHDNTPPPLPFTACAILWDPCSFCPA